MRVEANSNLQEALQAKKNDINPNKEQFIAELDRQMMQDVKSPQIDHENLSVEGFLDELTNLGAANFIYGFNMSKIQKMLEQKRQELEKTLGLDEAAKPPLKGEEKLDALKTIEEILKDYKLELERRMASKKQLEKPLQTLLSNLWS